MKLTLATLFVLMTTLGCSTIPLEDVQNATLYFPPQVRYIDEPRFCFAAAERKKALEEYKADGADTLFELVIDSDGKVKRARLLKTHVDPKYHEQMEQHARLFEFTKDTQGDRFRAFYFRRSTGSTRHSSGSSVLTRTLARTGGNMSDRKRAVRLRLEQGE